MLKIFNLTCEIEPKMTCAPIENSDQLGHRPIPFALYNLKINVMLHQIWWQLDCN